MSLLRVVGVVVLVLFFSECTSSRYITIDKVKQEQSIKIFTNDGKVYEGIVLENTGDQITLVSSQDHQSYALPYQQIRRVEPLKTYFDYKGYPISEAEIAKYKTNRNTWGHAIGGAVIGGLAGLAVGIPIWLANDNPPPLFVGGLGMVVGSIYLGAKGVKRDHQIAVETVRAVRYRETELEAKKMEEQKKLEQLRQEKQRLLEKLKNKKKQETQTDSDN
ncbi:MAG: hypothetical protein D6748_00350 [Calditrichaeota bacterium]|nr:MAG: hypothetical protein D6748_00350 [Calditrichota bacterium]